MNKKSFAKLALTVLLDSIIAVYTVVTLIIALCGNFFLHLGLVDFSISHIKKPLFLLLAAFILRKIVFGKFLEGLFSDISPLKYSFEIFMMWIKKIECWLTASIWRELAALLILGLLYSAAGTLLQRLPLEHGLLGEYYPNIEFKGAPLLSARDVSISVQRFNSEHPEIHTNYSIRWTGFLHAPRTGTYTLSTASDDGSWLYLDGKLVVDNGGSHGLVEQVGTLKLKRGVYPIEIRYVQQGGAAAMRAYWSVPAAEKRFLDGDALYTRKPSGFLLALRSLLRFGLIGLKVFGFVAFALFALHHIHPHTGRLPRIWGILWILAGSFGLELWFLRRNGLGQLTLPWELLLWSVNFIIVLICLGLPFHKRSLKTVLQNALLLLFSLFLLLGFFEIVLRTGMFDERGTIWIREKYITLNNEINAKNWELANKNPYKFTDIVREKEKPAGVSRVAVLGDSFVWGAAIPYETAWSHKLAKKIHAQYQNIEVMNWGYPGWSTSDEFNFLSSKGIQYAPDLLIVGFVRNDPDLGNYRWKLFDLRTLPHWYVQAPLWPFKKLFPNVFDFTAAHLNEFLMNYLLKDFGYGWQAWYDKIYSPQNLQRYYLLVKKLADFCEAEGIRLLFVLTPATYGEAEGQKLQVMASILNRLGIEYLNLHPATVRELSHYPSRQLWGNPGDAHPGDLMTELFANESFAYLEGQDILSSLEPK